MQMTREEAIEVLDDMKVKIDIPKSAVTQHKRNEALDMAISALKGGWIPVSERLPESSGVYTVSRWFSDGEERAILTDANYYDGCGEWYNDNRINWDRELVTDKIVAWMPKPEPYKGESEVKPND